MPDATPGGGFACPDLTTFCRLDELGLEVTGQRVQADRAVLSCRVTDDDSWCHRCGEQGSPRDTVIRQLAHEPCGWRPTTLLVTIRRYRCDGCRHVWRQDGSSILTGQSTRSLGCGPLFAGAVESYPAGRVLSIPESAADTFDLFDQSVVALGAGVGQDRRVRLMPMFRPIPLRYG